MNQALDSNEDQLKKIIDQALFLNGRTKLWRSQTRLYGNVPELDCLTVMNIIVEIEFVFGIEIDYYKDFNVDIFASVESLAFFISQKQKDIFDEVASQYQVVMMSEFIFNNKMIEK